MNNPVVKKSIFITGAASGIGRASALLFARRGWYVGLFDVDETGLSALRDEIGAETSCAVKTDVTCDKSVKRAAEMLAGKTGGQIDLLFNCAGVLSMVPNEKLPLHRQKKIVETNFIGIINCIDACLPFLKATEGARIVNMSSASALYGTPELAVYSATKFAVRGLTEALNIEFEPLGIIVCDVMAPYVHTPMITEAATKAKSVARLGVNVSPRQVANVVWKAAHGKKVHWKVGWFLKCMVLLMWAFPFATKPTMKRLAFSQKAESP